MKKVCWLQGKQENVDTGKALFLKKYFFSIYSNQSLRAAKRSSSKRHILIFEKLNFVPRSIRAMHEIIIITQYIVLWSNDVAP